ncbi:MAG: hypothetical protein ABSC56_06180 [Solirubrobacteraceae bacterium]|jgi:hypothetical protein
MSDLDQAIREHLALKRLHGADPSEVARQEQEVLGESSREDSAAFAVPYSPGGHADFEEFIPAAAVEEPRSREELVPPTNEYARARLRSYLDGGEATQEYTIDDRTGWSAGPAWQGGAA